MNLSYTRRGFLQAAGATWAGSALAQPVATAPRRSVIQILLTGGPAGLDTFDPKPDAAAEVRGPFGSIATRLPGIRFSELFPRLAYRADRLAMIRSIHHNDIPIHETGLYRLQTGWGDLEASRPHWGAWAQASQGRWVLMGGPMGDTGVDLPQGQSPGWLGDSMAPAIHSCRHEPDLVSRFVSSCRDAVDEITAGASAISINMSPGVMNQLSWDMHASSMRLFVSPEDYRRTLGPALDVGLSELIDVLEQRSLLDQVLVLVAGEMGRTPRLNRHGGRDHWVQSWSGLVAGGGITGGQVIGETDGNGSEIIDRPVSAESLAATALFFLGLEPLGDVAPTACVVGELWG